MKRFLSLAAVAVLALGGLTACGGDDYCEQAKSLTKVDPNVSEEEALKKIEELGASAPDEVKDDFDVISSLAGVDTADLSDEERADGSAAFQNIADYTSKECDVDLG